MTGREAWAVTSGEFSDYYVICLFEAEADANAAVVAGVGEFAESLRLYGPGEMPRKALMWDARATVTTDHAFAARHRWRPDLPPHVGDSPTEEWTHVEPGQMVTATNATEARLFCRVQGEDREAVLAAAIAWQREQKALHPTPDGVE